MPRLFSGPLLSERIEATGGRATGFDYMRFTLALAVIVFHSIVTSYGFDAQSAAVESPFGVLWLVILPMFFALSGFLVAGSLERSKSLGVFLGLRILRIFPALAVDTIFCALILGPLLTTLALSAYFAHPEFHAYFLNILGVIHYHLPGVFESNPSGKVNGQLWTIPVELDCYIALTVLAFLLLAFLFGVVFYQFRDRIRLSPVGFLVAVFASLAFTEVEFLTYLAAVPITYVTVYLGLMNPRKSELLASGDYSYGLFLYGYPLQQALMAWLPWAREWYWNLLLAIPLSMAFSIMSWHLIEKRVMARKHWLFSAQAWWDSMVPRIRKALLPRG